MTRVSDPPPSLRTGPLPPPIAPPLRPPPATIGPATRQHRVSTGLPQPQDTLEPHPGSREEHSRIHSALLKGGDLAQRVSSGHDAMEKATQRLRYEETLTQAKEFASHYHKARTSLQETERQIQILAVAARKNPDAATKLAAVRAEHTRLLRWLRAHRSVDGTAHSVIAAARSDLGTQVRVADAFRAARGDKLLPTLKKVSAALSALSIAVDTYRGYAESPCRTAGGKALNAALAGAVSYGLGASNPYLAVVDAHLPDGYKLADIHRGAAAAVSATAEAAIIGDERPLEDVHKKSMKGDYGRVMQEASRAGAWWADRGLLRGLGEFTQAVRMAFGE